MWQLVIVNALYVDRAVLLELPSKGGRERRRRDKKRYNLPRVKCNNRTSEKQDRTFSGGSIYVFEYTRHDSSRVALTLSND